MSFLQAGISHFGFDNAFMSLKVFKVEIYPKSLLGRRIGLKFGTQSADLMVVTRTGGGCLEVSIVQVVFEL